VLFDLRSRGRRRTVQAVYLTLALLMGGGLVLFGVGAGNGFGGILNAFTGGGGGGSQKQVVSQQEKAALQATRLNPNNPQGWASLVQARWISAGQGSNFDSSTGTFTAAGKKELTGAANAWQRYVQLTKSPDPNVATVAARAYEGLGNYAGAAGAWEIQTVANPNVAKDFECLALSAYAAKQNRKGDLAVAQALNLVPKAQRTLLKSQLEQAKTQPQAAQQC
jgi:hypothetical protein